MTTNTTQTTEERCSIWAYEAWSYCRLLRYQQTPAIRHMSMQTVCKLADHIIAERSREAANVALRSQEAIAAMVRSECDARVLEGYMLSQP